MSSSNTRKRDRYEARARELALAAGVDPDSRIERPGQRSMPAWCAYRDAARTERVATETAAVAAELPPQGPKYRDATGMRPLDRMGLCALQQACQANGHSVTLL